MRGMQRRKKSLKRSQKPMMSWVIKKKESCTTSLDTLPLQKALIRTRQVVLAAPASGEPSSIAMVMAWSFILKAAIWMIWEISLIPSLEVLLVVVAPVLAADLRALATVQWKEKICMQRSPYPLKMQPLAVTSRSRSLIHPADSRRLCRCIFRQELKPERVSV